MGELKKMKKTAINERIFMEVGIGVSEGKVNLNKLQLAEIQSKHERADTTIRLVLCAVLDRRMVLGCNNDGGYLTRSSAVAEIAHRLYCVRRTV